MRRATWRESPDATGSRRASDGGRSRAFKELACLWLDRLYAIARLVLRDDERAKDASQEALIVAWRDLRRLRDPDRFEPWLRRLLANACYREARKERRRQRAEGRMETAYGYVPDPATMTADRDELGRALMTLAPDQRALIVLHFYVGLPMQETALALGVPVGTVKSRLHRTIQQMRTTLTADARLPLIEWRATQ
jgi:RNA polymerase sigma-70 factor (ECF subfamily)